MTKASEIASYASYLASGPGSDGGKTVQEVIGTGFGGVPEVCLARELQ